MNITQKPAEATEDPVQLVIAALAVLLFVGPILAIILR